MLIKSISKKKKLKLVQSMKEFIKIVFRKITRKLKNIKVESKEQIHVLIHFTDQIQKLKKKEEFYVAQIYYLQLYKRQANMNLILGEMIIEKFVWRGAISKVIMRTGKNKFDFIFSFFSPPKVLHQQINRMWLCIGGLIE